MALNQHIARLLNIRVSESAGVTAMLGHAFFSGLGIALSFTAINVLLLENHGSHELPLIYSLSALVLMAGGFIYSKLEHRISPLKLFPGLLVFSTLWAFGARFIATEDQHITWLIGVYCSYFLMYQLNNLEFWGVAALIYDIRQSKRLFGVLASGESVAKILGYAVTPLMVKYFSLADLLIVSGFSFLISTVLLLAITRSQKENLIIEHAQHHKEPDKKQYKLISAFKFFNNLRSDKFMRNVALFAMFSTVTYYSIHYVFLTEVEENFANLNDLAFFFGLFFSVAKALNLIIKSLVSGRMLNLVGVRFLIVFLPIMLTLINLVGISGFVAASDPVKFFLWIFGFNMMIDEILRSSIHKPTYLTLFQPLQKNKRLEGHTITKGIMEPLGMGIAGITIILLERYGIFTPSNFIMYLLVFALVWLLTARNVSVAYKKLLANVLKSRLLSRQNVSYSKEELDLLRNQKLQSNDAFERLYAVKMLKDYLSDDEKLNALKWLLGNNNEDVLNESLRIIENNRIPGLEDELKTLLFKHDNEIGKKAIYCYCAQLEENCVEELMPYLETVSADWQEGILGGILKHAGIYGATIAGDYLLQWSKSDDPDLRKRVSRIIGDIGRKDYFHPLIALLNDKDTGVVQEAIAASGKVGNQKLVPFIIKLAGEKNYFNYCMRSLERMGKDAIPWIEQAIETEKNQRKQKKLIRIVSKIPSEATNAMLLKLLDSASFSIRNEAIYSLYLLQFKPLSVSETQLIENEIDKEVNTFTTLRKMMTEMKIGTGLPVSESLKHETGMLQMRLLYLLSYLYDLRSVQKIIDSLKTGNHTYQSNACELLENLLKRRHATRIVPIIEFDTHSKSSEMDFATESDENVCETLWQIKPGMVSDWLIALGLRCSRTIKNARTILPDYIKNSRGSELIQQELTYL